MLGVRGTHAAWCGGGGGGGVVWRVIRCVKLSAVDQVYDSSSPPLSYFVMKPVCFSLWLFVEAIHSSHHLTSHVFGLPARHCLSKEREPSLRYTLPDPRPLKIPPHDYKAKSFMPTELISRGTQG